MHLFSTFSAALGIARTSSVLHSLARKFALRFSAALGNMSKLYCTRLHENWLRLGIIQVNLASALALHKRSYKMHLWRRLGIVRPNKFVGLCSRLAQSFVSTVLGSTGALFAGYVLLVSLPRLFCYFNGYSRCPIIVGQLHRNYGATTIKGIKTIILLVGTTIKGKKLFFRRITLVFFPFIFLVNGNLVVVDYCTSY